VKSTTAASSGEVGSSKAAGKMNGPEHQPQLVAKADLLADIFQIMQLHARQAGQLVGQFGLLDKSPRGDDGADFGGIAGGLHGVGTGRIVEHGRHPVAGAHAENQAQRRGQIGQQQADPLARLR
jgi:hypothetical protein